MKNLSLYSLTILFAILSISTVSASSFPPNDTLKSLETPRNYMTAKVENLPPEIDGYIDDEAWSAVPFSSGFRVRFPDDGADPKNQTSFKILYDDKNLYLAFRCHDSDPDKIVKRLTRRDRFDGDWIEVNIDSYNDKRTAFSFTLNAASVIGDEFITNNGNNWDSNWNPIWYGKSRVDEDGWTAEYRIPLSQLRYGNKEVQEWGIQFTRYDFRHQERSIWRYISQNTAGWVSNFGKLEGIKGIKPQKQIEIQPYILAQAETFEKIEGNPYATGSDAKISAGLDAKFGVTSDFTIDLAINPDFGQVEADPAAINLNGYQIFFSERRPFFIENRNLFNFQVTRAEAGGPFQQDNVFYSRRIGSSPHGWAQNVTDGEYVNQPSNTTILGAAKFSGKTKKGTSIGIMESVTQPEYAVISDGTNERKSIVEPFTNYFVGRVQQDFKGGNSYIGGMLTAVNRNINDTYMADFLHNSAYSGAVDFMHRWKDQSWYAAGTGIFSRVNGTSDAILGTQTNFEHNYQRTDADHLKIDTGATSLSGHGGTLRLGKIGGNFKFESGFTWRSPGVELNDIGFLRQADFMTHYHWMGYRTNKPGKYWNNWRVNYNHWFGWDFGGTNTYQGYNVNAHINLKNFWGGGTGSNYNHHDVDTRALRGGPSLRNTRSINHWWYMYTDERKKIQGFVNGWNWWGFEKSGRATGLDAGITIQPTKTVNIRISPSYNRETRELQYVQNITNQNGETRYINGDIKNESLGLSMRFNYTIRPNMTIQYYGQPFIFRADYSDFKYITNAGAAEFDSRFTRYTDDQILFDEEDMTYLIDENRDGATDYNFYTPNFDFVQYRSNLVFRWEYTPGSTLFLVWTTGSNFFESSVNPFDRPLVNDLGNNLFNNTAHNIFLVKCTYRFLN